jgi:hypothetical protein
MAESLIVISGEFSHSLGQDWKLLAAEIVHALAETVVPSFRLA